MPHAPRSSLDAPRSSPHALRLSLFAPRPHNKPYMSKHTQTIVLLLALTLLFTASAWKIMSKDEMPNLYTHQAYAFLHGRLNIDERLYDTALFDGKFYVPFPPFPALLLVPFVAAFGVYGFKVTPIAIFLSLFNALVMLQVLKKLNAQRHAIWLCAAFFLGTAYWSMVRGSAGVWFFAHVVAVGCMLLAINEALGPSRGWLVGLLVGLAFLTRQLSIFHAVFLTAVLWQQPKRWFNLAGFAVALGMCLGVYLLFNYQRFGNMFDTGYSYLTPYGILKQRLDRFGLFNAAYVPFNFVYLFLQGFHIEYGGTGRLFAASPDPFGTSITFASPFIFAALWAKWGKLRGSAAWISIGLILLYLLFYYNNGSAQWNAQRFTLDFMPLLMVLVARGMAQADERLLTFWKGTIVYAVALNALTLFVLVP